MSRGERGFADYLRYAYVVPPGGVVALKDGSYVMGWAYEGGDFESATKEEIEHTAAMANTALCRLGSGWMAHFEMIRRPDAEYPSSSFTEPTNMIIDMERAEQHKAEGAHFDTTTYIFLTYLPPAVERSGAYKKFSGFFADSTNERPSASEEQVIEYMNTTARDMLDIFAQGMKFRRLSFKPFGDGVRYSGSDEMLQMLNYCVSGEWHPVLVTPYNTADVDTLLAKDAYLSVPMQMGSLNNRYVSVVSVMGYPLETYSGILNQMSHMPYELRWSNRFIFSDFRDAQGMLDSTRAKWAQKMRGFIAQLFKRDNARVNQDAVNMVGDTDAALTELNANITAYGKHTSVVVVRAATKEGADEIAHAVVQLFERYGFPARIETINATEAFLGSLPGHGYENVRKPYINAINLADIVPLSHEWCGEPYNPSPEIAKHYAKMGVTVSPPALIQATSSGSTPFRLNIHVSDLGHTLVLGPSGSGKSTLLALIASQFERYLDAQIFIFDRGYSMFPLCAALSDSAHYDLGVTGSKLSLCPLAEIDTVNDQGVALEWLESMYVLQGGEINPQRRGMIADAVRILAASTAEAENPAARRTMTAFLATLQSEDLRQVFEYYTLRHTGEMLDGASNDIKYAKTTVFEMEHLFNMSAKIVAPVFVHIFHQIEKRILSAYEEGQSGRPSLIIIDEAWMALNNKIFAEKIKEWLKVLRKNNCAVILATQSLDDVVNSSIMGAVLDSCETRVLLPNPNAMSSNMKDLYMKHLALSERQVAAIAHAEKKRQYYYACETLNYHRLFSLALGPVALSFVGAAGKEDLAEVRKLLKEHRDLWPQVWLEQRGLDAWASVWRRLYDEKVKAT